MLELLRTVIFEEYDVVKDDDSPYVVFTPW